MLFAAACILGLASPAQADYPDRPIKLIMPYAAGAGAMDLASRVMAEKLTTRMANPVIVVKQPGAGGTIAAVGTATHVAMEMFMGNTGIRMKHVSYGSNANYWNDLMGGQLDVVTAGITGGLALTKDGRLRMLATATRTRSPSAPDVMAVGEIVPGYDAPAWMGLVVAQGTPEAVVAKLESAAMEVLNDPSTKSELSNAGIEVAPLDRKAFGAKMAADLAVWENTLKFTGLTQ